VCRPRAAGRAPPRRPIRGGAPKRWALLETARPGLPSPSPVFAGGHSPAEPACRGQARNQRDHRHHRQVERPRPGAGQAVLQGLHARAERCEVADAPQRLGHRVPRQPQPGEEVHRVEQDQADPGGEALAGRACRHHQANGEQRDGRQQEGGQEAERVARQVGAEDGGADAEHQRHHQGRQPQAHRHLRQQQPGGPDRGGGQPAQDPPLPVVGQVGWQGAEGEEGQHQPDHDRHVQVDHARAAEVGVGLAEGRDAAEDHQQQRREGQREERCHRVAQEQLELHERELAKGRHRIS
jgi:hypothetical protein